MLLSTSQSCPFDGMEVMSNLPCLVRCYQVLVTNRPMPTLLLLQIDLCHSDPPIVWLTKHFISVQCNIYFQLDWCDCNEPEAGFGV